MEQIMNLTKSPELTTALATITDESNGRLVFEAIGYKHRLFVDGKILAVYRRSKVLGFCDGWRAKALSDEETPVYRGMSIQTGVYHVLRQLTDTQIMAAGDPKNNEERGFIALNQFCDANMLLPFAEDSFGKSALAYWNALIPEVSKVICNIWDYRMLNRHSLE